MKWLDDDIVFSFTPTQTGYQTYKLLLNNQQIYIGTLYTVAYQYAQVDVTNILNNYRYVDNLNFNSIMSTENSLCAVVDFKVETENIQLSQSVYLTHKYANNNLNEFINLAETSSTPFDENTSIEFPLQTTEYFEAVDDVNITRTKVLPRYPFIATNNYGFICTKIFESCSETDETYLLGDQSVVSLSKSSGATNAVRTAKTLADIFTDHTYADTLYFASNITDESSTKYNVAWTKMVVRQSTLSEEVRQSLVWGFQAIVGGTGETMQSILFDLYPTAFANKYYRDSLSYDNVDDMLIDIDDWKATIPLTANNEPAISLTYSVIEKPSSVYYKMPVAKIDECPARFYLMWQDRLGGIQSQPFEMKDIYTEDFTYSSFEDVSNHKRNYSVKVQPKWELHTGWIKDYEYPIYESIFVSPYVKLYDTKYDVCHNVVPTGKSYTEKTYKNQKKLFDFNITVELNKIQNILA